MGLIYHVCFGRICAGIYIYIYIGLNIHLVPILSKLFNLVPIFVVWSIWSSFL